MNVQHEFENYGLVTLNGVFLTLQGCLIEVMKDGGGNRYKIPHTETLCGILYGEPSNVDMVIEIVRKKSIFH